VLNRFPQAPRVFILRVRLVPLVDASGVAALRPDGVHLEFADNFAAALALAARRFQARHQAWPDTLVPGTTSQ
jgi:hypothetical protein